MSILSFASVLDRNYSFSHIIATLPSPLPFTSLSQACHELVPPDEVMPVVTAIANAFISDRSSSEAIQVRNQAHSVSIRPP